MPMDETWNAYETALLATMGCADGSFRQGGRVTYRLLLQPTFHRASCIAVSIDEGVAEAQIVVLEVDCHDIFMAAVKHDPRLSDRDFLSLRRCSCDVTELAIHHAE